MFHVVDDNGLPVTDYFIDFHVRQGAEWRALSQMEDARANIHTYSDDHSFRCFHIDVKKVEALGSDWALTISADSGTRYMSYAGWREVGLKSLAKYVGAVAAVKLRVRDGVEFFHSRTTTLVEVVIDSLPVPVETDYPLVSFPDREERIAEREAAARAADQERLKREQDERTARLDELEAGFRTDD